MRPSLSTVLSAKLLVLFPLLAIILGFSSAVYGQQAAPLPAISLNLSKLYQSCSGNWAGVLEYRDFQSNKHVGLPTNLESRSNGKGLTLKYTYDDGPGKIVYETATLTVDTEKRLLTMQSEENSSEQLTIAEAENSGSKVRLMLSGSGTENGQKVEARSTLACDVNTFTLLRETRLPGQDFAFRHKYSLTRFPIQAH